MPQTQHVEKHFTSSALVRDIVIGMADGLTVPFALAAGLSGAVDSTRVVITAGLAEIAAGSIAMGLGGYLAAKSDAEHYAAEKRREEQEVREVPREEMKEVADVFRHYGIAEERRQLGGRSAACQAAGKLPAYRPAGSRRSDQARRHGGGFGAAG